MVLMPTSSIGGDVQTRVEEFIEHNKLDEKVGDELRLCPEKVQELVLERGNMINDCRNPSALCVGRIRDAKAKVRQEDADALPPPDVEGFIEKWSLDEKVANILREAGDAIQAVVIDRGGMEECRNPNGVVLSRINDARRRGLGRSGAKADAAEVEEYIQKWSLDDKAADALRACTADVQHNVINSGAMDHVKNPSAMVLSRIKNEKWGQGSYGDQYSSDIGKQATPEEVNAFIDQHALDEKAAEVFREEAPEVQHLVISQGSLVGTSNPNAVVMSRIKRATQELNDHRSGKRQRTGDWEPSMEEGLVGMFAIMMGKKGGKKGKGKGWEGSLGPSSWGPIPGKGWGKGKGSGSQGHRRLTVPEGGLAGFIQENELDEDAAALVTEAATEVQEIVMKRGTCKKCTNKAAVIKSRINEAKYELGWWW